MGEFSKLVGDKGEDIVSHFLNLFGWKNHATNKYVTCHTRKHKKETHGIDALFAYNSPLESKVIENILISSKYSSNPYKSIPSNFKSHFEDIAIAIECYSKSSLKKDINTQIATDNKLSGYKYVDSGILFYINNDTNPNNQDILSKIKNSQINNDLKFRIIHVIDNKRASFLYDGITFINKKYGIENVNFYYPPTSLNLISPNKKYYGKILPVEYISSPILPFVIERNNNLQPIICLVSSEPFSADSLERLISCTRNLVSDISKELSFFFNDFNELSAKESIDRLKLVVGEDINFEVGSFHETFRG